MFSHMNKEGRGKMVDIGKKDDTNRIAKAHGYVFMSKDTLDKVIDGEVKKGDVLQIAQIAGIMAAKNTYQLIPLCHPILITSVDLTYDINKEEASIEIISEVKTVGKTGVEMEAMQAVTSAALTIYDMCKGIEKGIIIGEISLIEKSGGRSGKWKPELIAEGKILNLAISSIKGDDKTPVDSVTIIENYGIENDVHAGGKTKQVSLFAVETLKYVPSNKMIDVVKGKFTENITIVGIPIFMITPGKRIRINDVVLEIESIGKEEFVDDGRRYIVSRKGIFTHVIKGGNVKAGDCIGIINDI